MHTEVNNENLDLLFKKIRQMMMEDEDNACLILQKLKEIAHSFTPKEKSQAHNFQDRYLEIKSLLICDKFSRYKVEIIQGLE